jgi:flagellar hook protein FlgE
MIRSLFSGVCGMKVNQTKMDVIGNNIANVNTTAFKAGRVTFKDMLSQTSQTASSPTDDTSTPVVGRGGTNPKQVGLGVTVAGIDTNMTQGGLQPTSRATDVAIEGNGFFVISDGIETRYTRDGSFTLDKNGNLITSDGYHVKGAIDANVSTTPYVPGTAALTPDLSTNPAPDTLMNIKIPLDSNGVKLTSFGITNDGSINAVYGDVTVKVGQIALANFQNSAGLSKLGGNTYSKSLNSGDPVVGRAAAAGYGNIQQGMLEMSNVDLASEFTDMIVTSRAYQANSKTITTSDEMLQELINLKR